jgi:hypothetical protein
MVTFSLRCLERVDVWSGSSKQNRFPGHGARPVGQARSHLKRPQAARPCRERDGDTRNLVQRPTRRAAIDVCRYRAFSRPLSYRAERSGVEISGCESEAPSIRGEIPPLRPAFSGPPVGMTIIDAERRKSTYKHESHPTQRAARTKRCNHRLILYVRGFVVPVRCEGSCRKAV